jgi:hypothetical protein
VRRENKRSAESPNGTESIAAAAAKRSERDHGCRMSRPAPATTSTKDAPALSNPSAKYMLKKGVDLLADVTEGEFK